VGSSWDKRLEEWFGKRRWRVMAERDGTVTLDRGVSCTYRAGMFEIDPPGVYITPLGTRGRRGCLVIEQDEGGKDIPGSEQAFGESLLRRAQRAYGTVSGLPEEE
jgi:hypothetical protein